MSRSEPKARIRSRGQRWLLRLGWLLPLGALGVGLSVLVLTYAFASIPLPRDIKLESAAEVYDRNGNLIGVFTGEQRRFLIDTRELLKEKPEIGQAVIASEDRDFYEHNGISLRGTVRAAWANLTQGEITQGGSTITQQYVKQAVLQDPERTVTRKLKEAVLAIKLERRFSKKQILGFYLNTVYFGRGAYGIEAAARAYFGKHASDLDLAEAAYLAGIIPAPESYQPDRNQQGARARRDRALSFMRQQGYITEAEEQRASRGRIRLSPDREETASKNQPAAYFMEWLRRELQADLGNDLYTRGYKIHTTLDLDLQAAAEDSVETYLADKEDPEAALVSVTPTGAVRALVGGRSFTNVKKARGFNFVSDNFRQAGSAFKPFTLVTAIEENISPNSTFSGSSPKLIPECPGEDGIPPWEVDNFGGSSYGTLTLDQATTNSVNTVFAQLVAELGPEKVAAMVEKFGFDGDPRTEKMNPVTPNCSLALGTLDVTPLAMARAYAGLSASGAEPEIQPVSYIEDSRGHCLVIYRPVPQVDPKDCDKRRLVESTQVVDPNSADTLTQVLTHVVQGGTATAANIGRPVAGKTGTTQNNVNAWFAGYTPQLSTIVWMGYPRQKNGIVPEMRICSDPDLCRPVNGLGEITGGSIPAQIWAGYMTVAMQDLPIESFPTPTDLPDEVINPLPTVAPHPSPDKTPGEEPEPEPSEEPTPTPEPTVEPTPTPEPTLPNPTPTTGRRGAGPQEQRGASSAGPQEQRGAGSAGPQEQRGGDP